MFILVLLIDLVDVTVEIGNKYENITLSILKSRDGTIIMNLILGSKEKGYYPVSALEFD